MLPGASQILKKLKEECDEINALLQMALQNAERTEDEKDRAEIIFKIARSRKGIKRWTNSYIDQGVCEKRSDQLNRRVKRITSKMMVVRKAHPTNPERIKVFHRNNSTNQGSTHQNGRRTSQC